MRVGCTALTVAGVVLLCPALVSGQTVLTLADVLARAREQAPAIVSARLALDEARGRVAGASLRLPSNPEIDVNAGRRDAAGVRSADFEVGVFQALEPPGRRAARMAGATARLDQAVATAEETTRAVLWEAAATFYRAVYTEERLRLLRTSMDLAAAIHQAADRRFRAGDLAILDVNLARVALARSRAEVEAAGSERAAALGALRAVLRIDGEVEVQGSLRATSTPDEALLTEAVAQRPELRVLEAAIRDADAEIAQARALARPDYGVGLRYQREGDEDVVLGAFTVSLPVFSNGQELRATGAARGAHLRAELTAARTRVRVELQTALAAYEHRAAAVRVLEAEALPGLDENNVLATRSFDVGRIGLPDVLLIRRELLETRSHYLSALLEAALARVAVDATAAVLR